MMLYPKDLELDIKLSYPSSRDFEVRYKDDNTGKGVYTFRSFERGDHLAKMAGSIISEIRQHTLQVSPGRHLYDPFFSGYFLHSCDPNIELDMQELTVTALKDIPTNSYLYMDYSQTEDELFREFPCGCGSKNCRGWIKGKVDVSKQLYSVQPSR